MLKRLPIHFSLNYKLCICADVTNGQLLVLRVSLWINTNHSPFGLFAAILQQLIIKPYSYVGHHTLLTTPKIAKRSRNAEVRVVILYHFFCDLIDLVNRLTGSIATSTLTTYERENSLSKYAKDTKTKYFSMIIL